MNSEIAEEKVKVPDLVDSAVYKLRKHVEQIDDVSDEVEDLGDDFESLYKGEISKSGVPILPSKRARKIPEKIQVSQEDLDELTNVPESQVEESKNEEVSLDQMTEEENNEKENEEVKHKQNKDGVELVDVMKDRLEIMRDYCFVV